MFPGLVVVCFRPRRQVSRARGSGCVSLGETSGYKVSVPTDVDVKAIRGRLNMTQAKFSDTFGFSLDAVKHWEGGRRTPESSARAFLTVISRNPQAVISALHPTKEAAVTAPKVMRATPKRASRHGLPINSRLLVI
jgi:hypothetical protein